MVFWRVTETTRDSTLPELFDQTHGIIAMVIK